MMTFGTSLSFVRAQTKLRVILFALKSLRKFLILVAFPVFITAKKKGKGEKRTQNKAMEFEVCIAIVIPRCKYDIKTMKGDSICRQSDLRLAKNHLASVGMHLRHLASKCSGVSQILEFRGCIL